MFAYFFQAFVRSPIPPAKLPIFFGTDQNLNKEFLFGSVFLFLFYPSNTESHVFYNNDTEVVVTFCADSAVSASERLVYCIYQFLVMFALPTTVMSFCYSKVIYVLWISTKQLAQMTFTESADRVILQSSIPSGRLPPLCVRRLFDIRGDDHHALAGCSLHAIQRSSIAQAVLCERVVVIAAAVGRASDVWRW
ncbi:unnamed protein product [Acanthosepion pharaonis]|uniref:G protein-coupled receptor n=1 Tax=Acanthosepion pharaonis TaxID=158019 RepID=A0A812E4A2_ACAPH|nr:unnamed protein product [Sepia pharaonis]